MQNSIQIHKDCKSMCILFSLHYSILAVHGLIISHGRSNGGTGLTGDILMVQLPTWHTEHGDRMPSDAFRIHRRSYREQPKNIYCH